MSDYEKKDISTLDAKQFKVAPVTEVIPKNYLDLMQKGICPVCNEPMVRVTPTHPQGKKTHSPSKAIVCETKLREMVGMMPNLVRGLDGKLYEVVPKLVQNTHPNGANNAPQ